MRRVSSVVITALFALTAFLGAGLLFVVQPMIARIVLPLFGGSATVWSTCSLFFQLVLLLGYLYVHEATTRLRRPVHLWVHAVVILLPLAVLPVTVPTALGQGGSPELRLLAILTLMIGLPFAVLSTTGPLLQRWYSWTPAARSDDPYFLFAASNLGSFGGLLAYPLVIERTLDRRPAADHVVGRFRRVRRAGRGVWRRGGPVGPVERRPASAVQPPPAPAPTVPMAPARRTQLTWFGLAFLPSALLLAVTSHISTDVAAVPLLWVVPLALYLATFVVAFARQSRSVPPLLVRGTVALAALVLAVSFVGFPVPITIAIGLDLLVLTLVAFVSHARLAALRPPVEHLTRFYLVVAMGGAAGGLLNGLVAPMAFDRVWEYPGALLASLLLGVGILGTAHSPLARRYGRRGAIGLQGMAVAAAGHPARGAGGHRGGLVVDRRPRRRCRRRCLVGGEVAAVPRHRDGPARRGAHRPSARSARSRRCAPSTAPTGSRMPTACVACSTATPRTAARCSPTPPSRRCTTRAPARSAT